MLRPRGGEELLQCLEGGDLLARALERRAALIVVDSVAAAARGDFARRGDLADRQRFLARVATSLKRVATEASAAVVCTNHVMADFAGAAPARGPFLEEIPRRRVAATPRPRRGYTRGDESRG